MSRLLAYLGKKYFEGATDQIKEYTIAVEHFGRPADFSSTHDPFVRVHANRLRQRLQRYYRAEGKDHPIQISIPPGQYAPQFCHHPVRGDDRCLVDASSQPAGRMTEPPGAAPTAKARRGWRLGLPWTSALFLVGGVLITAVVLWMLQEKERPAAESLQKSSMPAVAAVSPELTEEIRILSGCDIDNRMDERGKTWRSDRYFTGGYRYPSASTGKTYGAPLLLCEQSRLGDFKYDIPLKPGIYELHLYFAEILTDYAPFDITESTRTFDVKINGQTRLKEFDVLGESGGPGMLDEKVFTDIRPADDGKLHLEFRKWRDDALLSGIEILPGIPGKIRPVRLTVRNKPYVSRKGEVWEPDCFRRRGGKQVVRAFDVSNTPDPELYATEQYGYLRYTIPVSPGKYRVTLRFSENYFDPSVSGPQGGERVFDVQCNGRLLLQNFNIGKEAGGLRKALDKVFTGVLSDPQDKIRINLIASRSYACINAVEVLAE